uniref:IQ motif and SEC7 domain-containing protein 3 n=1 Tax=Poecilia mexicana TaxID=48701 RepID=A0A3B3YSL9_9TELE
MESLLDNPMKAVLYLKELTTIVQNQQSLIQTQRQRIDELERKVEDLIGENRQLRDPHLYVQQPPSQHHHHHQHHQHPTQRSASPQAPAHLHQHPGSATKAAAHLGQQLPPPPQQQQQQPPPPQQQQIVHQTAQPQQQQQQQQHPTPTAPSSHHPQQLQLVPTSPQSPKVRKAGSESAEDDKRSACCKSLVPQTPSTLCRSVGLARKAE